MPRPKWSIGRRTNADGSGGSTPTPTYTDFGVLKFTARAATPATNTTRASLQVDFVRSVDGVVIDTFTLRRGNTHPAQ
jgi:hypothetical protein